MVVKPCPLTVPVFVAAVDVSFMPVVPVESPDVAVKVVVTVTMVLSVGPAEETVVVFVVVIVEIIVVVSFRI